MDEDRSRIDVTDPVEGKVKEDSRLVLVVAISVIVVLLLLQGIASAVIILKKRGSPLASDSGSGDEHPNDECPRTQEHLDR